MSASIAEQAASISHASAKHVPAELMQVFTAEQSRWREQGEPSGIISAGDTLDDFTLPDATGVPVSLSELVADGPAVIVFYRGGWCPYCNLALRAYQSELLPQLERYDARLVAISPQSPDRSLSTTEKAELTFTVLSDADARVAHGLGIAFEPAEEVLAAQRSLGLDLRDVNVDGAPDLPMPTVLVVDCHRGVRFADTQADYTRRTEVPEIIAALDAHQSRARMRREADAP
jgi:peroxiredoxin